MVLIMWAACYGRCLAEQCGVLAGERVTCCHLDDCGDGGKEGQDPPPCDVCEFITTGGVQLAEPLELAPLELWPVAEAAPPLMDFPVMISASAGAATDELDTGPPHVPRMCEWMASTAAPVRGPNSCA